MFYILKTPVMNDSNTFQPLFLIQSHADLFHSNNFNLWIPFYIRYKIIFSVLLFWPVSSNSFICWLGRSRFSLLRGFSSWNRQNVLKTDFKKSEMRSIWCQSDMARCGWYFMRSFQRDKHHVTWMLMQTAEARHELQLNFDILIV